MTSMAAPPQAEPYLNKFIRMPLDLNRRIRDFRFSRRIPSEAEAIRVLLTYALDRQRTPRKATNTNTEG